VDDPTPSLVKSLIPDAGRVRMNVEGAGIRANAVNAFVVDALAKIVLHEIHLVDEAEDDGGWTILFESFDDLAVSDEIALEVTRFNVEHVYQDGNFGEDVLALGGKVAVIESILSVTGIRVSNCLMLEAFHRTHPPQSQRLRVRLPRNLTRLCSTSIVAPKRRTSLGA